jgi:putative drug exporter of the RND superfamily
MTPVATSPTYNVQRPAGRLARLADLVFRHRGRVVIAWVVGLALLAAGGGALAGKFDAEYSTPGSESDDAAGLIESRFEGQTSSETIDVIWQAPRGATSPPIRRRIEAFVSEVSRLEGIGEAQRPRVSSDGTIAMQSLQLTERGWDVPVDTGKRMISLAEQAEGDGLRIELAGGPIQEAQGGGTPEVVGLLAAALILLVAFGSVVAAGLPLATAIFGLAISTGLIGLGAHLVDIPEWAPGVASLIGIGVGIDYALLILTRFRAAMAAGADRREAIVESVSTAGRSVLIAGTVVMVSLLGLFLMGLSYARGVAVSSGIAVLVVMLAALTLVPALLSYLGARVNRLHIPGLGDTLRTDRGTPAARWSRSVQRRPWTAAALGALVLIALTIPAAGLRLGFPDAGNDREGTTTRAAYELVSQGFGPGANGPLLVVAELPPQGGKRALGGLSERLRAEHGIAFVSPPQFNQAGDTAVIAAVPATSPQSQATEDLVNRLRDDVLPSSLEGTGVDAKVGGVTASFVDQSESTSARLPVFIATVVGLSFLLLLVAFRSPLIAIKAGLMNLLSVGAAYGVISLAADGGWFGELFGIDTATPVAPFIPVMMFAILFGLSMDYEVFLLSRVREEYLRTGRTHDAVADGLARTARVITAAAAIMVVVFLAFLVSDEVFLKLLGIGMATAIFVDATVVRMVLVPAVMQLMGQANWWIPRWLDRILPKLDVERAGAARAPRPGAQTAVGARS